LETEKKFMDLCADAVKTAGFNLVRVSWKNGELTLYIDVERPQEVSVGGATSTTDNAGRRLDDGVGLDDCERVTRAVEPIIEANDTDLGENYRLSVSSIGVDGKDWE
jgi:ribosome maturation factor RimP